MTSKITTALAALCALLTVPASAAVDCLSTVWTLHSIRTEAASSVENIQTLDYDSDGVLDLVGTIRVSSTPGQPESRSLYSWHGLGGGNFATPVSLGMTDVVNLLAIDANSDGRRDLVMTTVGGIAVRLNNGSGFDQAWSTGASYNAYALSAGHYDVDGYIDLAVTSFANNKIILYRGNALGQFSSVAEIETSQFPTSAVMADFDGDGRTDVAYTLRTAKKIEIAYHNADGTFTAATSFPASDYPNDLAVADFDVDGRPDLVVAHWADSLPYENDLLVVKNNGSRTFTTLPLNGKLQGVSRSFSSIETIDVNKDGHIDIVVAGPNNTGLITYNGNGDGTFRSPTIFRPSSQMSYFDFALGDFDGDTDLDVAIGSYRDLVVAKNGCGVQLGLLALATNVTYGQPAPLLASLSGISVRTPFPRGTVSFREGQAVLGTVEIGADGSARLDKTGLSLGTHTITAYATGSSEAPDAVSQTVTVNVSTAKSTTTLTPLTANPVYGTPYQFDVAIEYNEERLYAFYTLSVDGVETLRYENRSPVSLNLALGTYTIIAYYYGDQFRPASTSAPLTVTVSKSTPTFAYAGGARSVQAGTPHTLHFLVGAPEGAPVGGTVQLIRKGAVLATGTVSGSGAAQLSVQLERGVHPVTAVYSGTDHLASRSLDLTLTVLSSGSFVVDAHSTPAGIEVASVLPPGATTWNLYRRVAGTPDWTVVILSQSQIDPQATTRGVLYEYRMEAYVDGYLLVSNIDGAILFTDESLAGGVVVKRAHFDELRLAVNSLRSAAGLPAFEFEAPYGSYAIIRAAHLSGLRTALTQARAALGMSTPVFTDASLAGVRMKAIHIQELREQIQ